jgi:glycosyltransferase involved in cell wall biosynthesis
MRIAIVSRAENVSGKEIMTLELGEGLRIEGHSVKFVTSYWNDGTYPKRLKNLGFKVSFVDLGSISATLRWDCLRMTILQMLRLPRLWESYRRLLRLDQPEHVIHTSWHHLLLLFPLLTPRRDWYWIHEVLPDKTHYGWVFRQLSERLRGFIPVSNAVRESLLALGIPENKIQMIHNGLRDPVNVCADTVRVQSDGIQIGIVGQVEEWKGHHNLLDAFAKFAHKSPDASVHVFGSGSPGYTKRLKEQAASLGISNRIFWHGFIDSRASIYQQLDLCVVPVPIGATEALPTIAIEAAFFGLPVVASRLGGLPEIIEDGHTGFLVEAGNIEELCARLEQLLTDEVLRHRMGDAARQLAQTRFSHVRFVSDFIQILASPLAQGVK